MDLKKVEESINKVEPGLLKYVQIMKKLHETDVSNDLEFQRLFNGYYRIRQRTPEFYHEYYKFLEKNKTNYVSFDLVLNHFYDKFNRLEPSFSSKIAATINPNFPVWDEYVLRNLGLKKPAYGSKNRINKMIRLYNDIVEWYVDFLQSYESRNIIKLFDNRYKDNNLTDTKKIDLILWQMR